MSREKLLVPKNIIIRDNSLHGSFAAIRGVDKGGWNTWTCPVCTHVLYNQGAYYQHVYISMKRRPQHCLSVQETDEKSLKRPASDPLLDPVSLKKTRRDIVARGRPRTIIPTRSTQPRQTILEPLDKSWVSHFNDALASARMKVKESLGDRVLVLKEQIKAHEDPETKERQALVEKSKQELVLVAKGLGDIEEQIQELNAQVLTEQQQHLKVDEEFVRQLHPYLNIGRILAYEERFRKAEIEVKQASLFRKHVESQHGNEEVLRQLEDGKRALETKRDGLQVLTQQSLLNTEAQAIERTLMALQTLHERFLAAVDKAADGFANVWTAVDDDEKAAVTDDSDFIQVFNRQTQDIEDEMVIDDEGHVMFGQN